MYSFGVAMGNEEYAMCMLFNKLFPQLCPSVSHVEEGQKYSKFVFVLDCNKELEKS